ncbi:conserved membrane hypothetical protein [Burkholderia diffusa]|uniref:hypothetical protein n=1 Tax=Burkholderia diffusa TaxID=488732 RepID=UPI001CACDF60|nr:hypothetical protein [Burkholderia diffusa]CAG9261036.1 conserved membrane hypothetical protein [Burkholderia diffusa]
MFDVEASFEKLIGRQPTEMEVQSLYRVKNALGIHDNDALWMVLMALESYDALYRKYPAMISDHLARTLNDQKSVMAAMAEAETKKALGALADAVIKTSERVAVKRVDASRWLSWGTAWFAFTVFGSLCVFVGFVLGSGRFPYWAVVDRGESPATIVIGSLARTPAGWIAASGATAAIVASLYRVKDEVAAGKRLKLVAAGICMLGVCAAFLWPIFGPIF